MLSHHRHIIFTLTGKLIPSQNILIRVHKWDPNTLLNAISFFKHCVVIRVFSDEATQILAASGFFLCTFGIDCRNCTCSGWNYLRSTDFSSILVLLLASSENTLTWSFLIFARFFCFFKYFHERFSICTNRVDLVLLHLKRKYSKLFQLSFAVRFNRILRFVGFGII